MKKVILVQLIFPLFLYGQVINNFDVEPEVFGIMRLLQVLIVP